jgi:hypothetical protein
MEFSHMTTSDRQLIFRIFQYLTLSKYDESLPNTANVSLSAFSNYFDVTSDHIQ